MRRYTGAARRQAGAAVLVAMLVVALAAMAASGFMFRAQVEWRRLENLTRQDQAHWVLRATERWGAAVLRDDARQNSVDHPGEAWATRLPPVEAEGYRVSGGMEDQDGRFNLNNLVLDGKADAAQLLVFTRLLHSLALPENLADAVVDWMDEDDAPRNQESAESAYYAGRMPAYRAANRPLVSLNELLRVKGFDRQVVSVLRPFVALLPIRTVVNVNTARPEVLAALVEGMALSEAYAMVAKRERGYYRNIQDFQQALPAGLNSPGGAIAVSSSFFLVQARIRRERLSIGSKALFHRVGSNPPTLVWRAEL
jgi:general secretion pathway protein K